MANKDERTFFKRGCDTTFQELVSVKNSNCFYFNNEKYQQTINSIKSAKEAKCKTTSQYHRLKQFDSCSVSRVEKLVARVSANDSTIKYYVKNDEMFDILHETH